MCLWNYVKIDSVVWAVELAEKCKRLTDFNQIYGLFLNGHLRRSLQSLLGCQAKYCNPLPPFGVPLWVCMWSFVEMDSKVLAVELAEKWMRLLDFNQKCGHFLSGHLHESWHSRLGCQVKYCNPLLPFGVLLKMCLWNYVEIDSVVLAVELAEKCKRLTDFNQIYNQIYGLFLSGH